MARTNPHHIRRKTGSRRLTGQHFPVRLAGGHQTLRNLSLRACPICTRSMREVAVRSKISFPGRRLTNKQRITLRGGVRLSTKSKHHPHTLSFITSEANEPEFCIGSVILPKASSNPVASLSGSLKPQNSTLWKVSQ